jgi:hypothetical protein
VSLCREGKQLRFGCFILNHSLCDTDKLDSEINQWERGAAFYSANQCVRHVQRWTRLFTAVIQAKFSIRVPGGKKSNQRLCFIFSGRES